MQKMGGTLEGSIAAGKTTLGRVLEQSGQFVFLQEPLDEWRGRFGGNFLELFYTDMGRWGFTFQVCALVTRTQKLVAALEDTNDPRGIVVSERSPLVDLYVFSTLLRQDGLMSELEYQLYATLQKMISAWRENTKFILYLRTPASVCMERIRERDRPEERDINLAYLKKLEELHDQCLLEDSRTILLDGQKWWTAEEVEEKIQQTLRLP